MRLTRQSITRDIGRAEYEHATFHHLSHFSTTSEDMNRVFYGHVGKKSPWYFGAAKTGMCSAGSYVSSASRYGDRGAANLKKYDVSHKSSNSMRTRDPKSPDFLEEGTFVDEFTPKLTMSAPKPKGNSHSSPRLWPETSMYPTGYKHKTAATSSWYLHQTTSHDGEPNEHYHDMHKKGKIDISHKIHRSVHLDVREDDDLTHTLRSGTLRGPRVPPGTRWDDSTISTKGAISTSRPRTVASSLASIGSLCDDDDASFNSTASTSSQAPVMYEMKFSGNNMLMLNTGMTKSPMVQNETLRYELKRQGIARLHSLILRDVALPQPTRTCYELAATFKEVSDVSRVGFLCYSHVCPFQRISKRRTADQSTVSRDQFMEVLNQTVDNYTRGFANQLFSTFDPVGRGRVEYALVLSRLYIISDLDEPTIEKVASQSRQSTVRVSELHLPGSSRLFGTFTTTTSPGGHTCS